MKRALLTLCMAACCLPAFPQTKLVSTMKPVEQQHCSFDQYTPPRVGNRTYSSNSFYLKAPDGGLIASQEQAFASYELDGSVYKCASFLDSYGKRLSISNMMGLLSERMSKGRSLNADITMTQPMVAAATVGLASLESISDVTLFGKYVKTGTKVLSQCKDDIDEEIDNARAMIDYFSGCVASGLSVDGKSSSDTVLILRPEANEKAPASMQRLDFFDF